MREGGRNDHPLVRPPAGCKALIEELRLRIQALERFDVASPGRLSPAGPGEPPASVTPPWEGGSASPRTPPVQALPSSCLSGQGHIFPWTFGEPAIDALLPTGCLSLAGLHELKPETYADWPATLALGLMLGVRRLEPRTITRAPQAPVLWCWKAVRAHDVGRLYGPGLEALGLPSASLLIVEARKEADVLWAMEEGLKSRALALVAGCLCDVALTPARRLSLAAEAHGTPCLIMTDPRSAGTPAVTTRWRVARAASAPHAFDVAAPGRPRIRMTLERARGVPILEDISFVMEWRHDTHCFNLVAGLADRADAAADTGARAGRPSVRAG